ncbi:MAG: hypothetical protein ACN4E2_05120 [Nitrospinota bacterium]
MYLRTISNHKLWLIAVLTLYCSESIWANEIKIDPAKNQSYFLKNRDVQFTKLDISKLLNKKRQDIRWFKKNPKALDYDNTANCKHIANCLKEVQYDVVEIVKIKNHSKIPLREFNLHNSLGTHNLIVEINNKRINFQLVVRRGDQYPDILTELIGVPFIYAPTKNTNNQHQTDIREGADCIALVIYGQRRNGRKIPYFAPRKLYEYTDLIGNSEQLSDARIKAGDILHFGYQTAVISIDNKPIGVLGNEDIIIHTFHKLAEEIKFEQLPYRKSRFDILRWNL